MTDNKRIAVVVMAAGLFSAGALAQPAGDLAGTGNAVAFRNMTTGEVQQKRTAELLAATQQNSAPVFAPRPGTLPSGGFDNRFTVTRQTQSSSGLYAAAPTVPPPPVAYGGYAPVMMASAAPVDASAPAPSAYANSYGMASSPAAIPAMPDARPGECFALVRVPEKFRTYQKDYELRAASERLQTVAPRYEMVTEQYVAQEAYERLEVVPATFRTVTEQVEVAAPSSRYVTTEPVYDTVTEQVLKQPARTVWKRGNGPISRIDNASGEIMCLVEEPAVYETVTRRVLKTPAQAQEVPVPGQTALVSRRVTDQPAQVRRVVVPEQIATRTVRKLVEPGRVERIPIPAQMGSTTVRELVEPARLEWRSILCETNMNPDVIRRVQDALAREGFNPGSSSGRLDAQTINALNAYQRARSLPEDRYLNMDTVRALGVM